MVRMAASDKELRAILFTDIVGSTMLKRRIGDTAGARMSAQQMRFFVSSCVFKTAWKWTMPVTDSLPCSPSRARPWPAPLVSNGLSADWI